MSLRAPALPPRFEAPKRIGSGGMGVVYEAVDVERGARVALKTVIHRDADALARFKHEFRALQGIHHPNLVELGELIGDTDHVFFTMELVEGVDLLTWVRGERKRSRRPPADSAASATMVDLPTNASDTFDDEPPTDAMAEPTPRPDRSGDTALRAASFDETRLRDAFRQIALGLNALHDSKRIHRDIKPSNIRVTAEGRVVLLDFGLVFDAAGGADRSIDLSVVGTPAYMAPEQASSLPVGPAADWYAVGVVLYQCLTGRLPFEGAPLAMLMAKQYKEPPSPSAVVSGIASELEDLCVDLLKFEPGARPTGRDVLRRLNAPESDVSGPITISQPASAPFVGRARELVELERGYAQARTGAVTVALYGESGVGKSCLVKRFLEKSIDEGQDELDPKGESADVLDARRPIVLSGRCYEREAVPYKAFDEVIDTLSRKLARLEKEVATALIPPGIESAAQLFPALCRVPGVSAVADARMVARGDGVVEADPHERRRAAFQAIRELFARIGEHRRLVILIDDLQWTDADSLALLIDLLQPPAPPRLFLALTLRTATGPGGEPELPQLLASLPGDVRPVKVGRLAPADARQLAATLLKLRASPSLVNGAGMIAAEAEGHPLFIDELVRHASVAALADTQADDAAPSSVAPRLDDVLWARVLRLERAERRVLDVACVIGAPAAQELVAQAAGLDLRDFVRSASLLRTSNLVRTGGARASDAIEPYHDRVREAVVARLTPEERRACHESVAAAIEASKAYDPEVLAVHWAGAGQEAKASRYMVIAAEQAALALAFQRAARLYQRAIDLAPDDDARRRPLRRRLGEALANAGQGPLAAAEYERAAIGAGAGEALDLRRRAAEQLLRAGRHEEGLDATAKVLAAVGLSLPETTFTAIVLLFFYRFLILIRGLGFTPRDESDIAPSELTRLDVCWSVSFTLPYADLLRGAVFQSLHVLLAVRAGERVRVARALATEAGYMGTRGPDNWARTERAIARANEEAERTGQPYARATALVCAGIAHCMNLRFAGAIERLSEAIEIFRARCPGSAWEITTSQFFYFVSMYYACRFKQLRELHEIALKDAVDRGDHYGAVTFRIGVLNRIWWLSGDSARARRELAEARAAWPSPNYHVIHFHLAVAECYVDLYDGEWERAHAHAVSQGPALKRSLLLHAEALRLEWLGLTLRTALAAAAAIGDARPAERDALLRDAEAALKSYGNAIDHPMHRPMLLSARASMLATRGELAEARALVERMLEEPESEEGWAARECARWILGRLRGGIEGAAQVRAAEAQLLSRGISPDRRVPLVLFPGMAAHV
jgi:serine/threonine protein kinase/tetratricopeptide (TPR) repeat protein